MDNRAVTIIMVILISVLTAAHIRAFELPTSFGDDVAPHDIAPPPSGKSTLTAAAAAATTLLDMRAEEERILAQHFPNKDDSDYEEDEYDDDDGGDGQFEANMAAGRYADVADREQLPEFLEQPRAAFVTRLMPATLRCKVAHALQVS